MYHMPLKRGAAFISLPSTSPLFALFFARQGKVVSDLAFTRVVEWNGGACVVESGQQAGERPPALAELPWKWTQRTNTQQTLITPAGGDSGARQLQEPHHNTTLISAI